jgi:hypothetical protein
MARRKILFIVHNHPSVVPGGAETYALELYEALRASPEFEPLLLARAGAPTLARTPHDTPFGMVNGDANQYFCYASDGSYDRFFGTSRDKELFTRHMHQFLLALRPDVVHVQHTHFLGFDLLRAIKNALPATPIVYTLHEYLPICFNNGQMVRTQDQQLCRDPAPVRCHQCFPLHSSPAFLGGLVSGPQPISPRTIRRLGHPSGQDSLRRVRPATGERGV